MDNQEAEEMPSEDPVDSDNINMTEFSDEILLNILKFVPTHDVVLSVRRVCKKFANLCLDKSLVSTVRLTRDYQASDDKVKQMIREIASQIQVLSMSSCYWLSGPTVDQMSKCKSLVKLDLSGCRLTSLRLSKILSCLWALRSLAIDISHGFDSSQLSSESKATLSHLTELKQTLHTPSYGVVPCCTSLERLLLYFEIHNFSSFTTSCQLMVGQSSVPHYQSLRIFYSRLAPGYVNQVVMRLYLTVFSMRIPQNLQAFVISIPGNFPESGAAAKNLLEGMARNVALEALQLPKTWVDGSCLPHILKLSTPSYLNFSRCLVFGNQLVHDGKDLKSLVSLNLSGCVHCLSKDCSRKAEDDIDCDIVETLVNACPNIRHLNLSAAHHHSPSHSESHVCTILSKLKHLRSLALPVCTVSEEDKSSDQSPSNSLQPVANSAVTLGLIKSTRIGVKTYNPRNSSEQSGRDPPNSSFKVLLDSASLLEELELIGSSFSSSMPRNEPAIRKELPPCVRARQVGDEDMAAVGRLGLLQRLTLAQLPGIVNGAGLVQVGMKCQELQVLSLANLGMLKKVTYMPSLIETLKHCKQLKDFRLEQPYISANSQFFQALSHCPSLQRLCIISRHGTFQPDAVMSFMASCRDVIMCHMFTGETLVACRNLQQALLQSFQEERPALNVIVYPLLHEGLVNVIRDAPLVHLEEITLFKSRVAEDPPHLWW
ncbi:F-box/LRR-repeat protein 18 isoform X1 [Acipenser ruthenus]|uniref:F-box/LRR-repeat protein 18 isoform X1 n=1 Tax=Acipenser ruthenus TaxID=7906 RepID=UPI00155FAAE0|nr:F-box/LRR-repeat protein 18 isoform X1 [Acipenser ruthenus]